MKVKEGRMRTSDCYLPLDMRCCETFMTNSRVGIALKTTLPGPVKTSFSFR